MRLVALYKSYMPLPWNVYFIALSSCGIVMPICCVCAAAAEIAVDLMWQEDLGHPLCRALSWQACHLRLAELLASPPQPADDAPETHAADDDEEVISVMLPGRNANYGRQTTRAVVNQ